MTSREAGGTAREIRDTDAPASVVWGGGVGLPVLVRPAVDKRCVSEGASAAVLIRSTGAGRARMPAAYGPRPVPAGRRGPAASAAT